ncbi:MULTISPECIES: response regulator transcription factor [unclassified Streptomyces]|uniref:response regulator n=1 Tax=unclassified Streptomyces TaxID=2593676 RepID=UPI00278BD2A4|nr:MULTISPECIES: response regulator transcription factor [unclassified Streptomyces]
MQGRYARSPGALPDRGPTLSALIADSHALLRLGLRALLEDSEDLRVVGEAEESSRALELCAELRPDVVLISMDLPPHDGLATTREVVREGRRTGHTPAVLILSAHPDFGEVRAALSAGAAGILNQQAAPEEIAPSVRAAAHGATVLSREAVSDLLAPARHLPGHIAAAGRRMDRLGEGELQVLRLIGEGMSNAQIAATAHLSLSSVKAHTSRLLSKLQLTSRTQAALLAYESGLSSPLPARTDPVPRGARRAG